MTAKDTDPDVVPDLAVAFSFRNQEKHLGGKAKCSEEERPSLTNRQE